VAAANYARLDIANTFAADQTLNAALNLAQTTGADVGVINLGGSPLIHACCPKSMQNTFVGTLAGNFTADATGSNGGDGQNTATGFQAMAALTSGFQNTASGIQALYSNTSGYSNTANGIQALYSNTTGYGNAAYGSWALYFNTTGLVNTANGSEALLGNTTGNSNVAIGPWAGMGLQTGSSNIMVGPNAGFNFTSSESNNIDIGNQGVAAESGVIRVGTDSTQPGVNCSTTPCQTATYIAAIRGVSPGGASPLPVIIDGNGQLGTGTSAVGTVTSVGSGAGLTGGPITGSGTLSIATGGVSNTMLTNSSLAVNAGSGLSGGGSVALGGSTSLSVATGGVTNAMLANPSLTVTAGTGLTGGGAVSLGGSTTLNLNPIISATTGTFSGSTSPVVSGTNTGNSSNGQLGTSVSGNAAGVYGTSASSTGYGVVGNNTATGGNAYGVYGTTASSVGAGVYGSGADGVYGSGTITGVYGMGSTVGVFGDGSTGVKGFSTGTNSGTGVLGSIYGTGSGAYAVWGYNSGSGGYAGYFQGDVNVTGTLYSGVKDFLIDHPLDAANKYLYHSSVESSEMMNIYTGNVILQASGEAVVELPEWFEAVNADFRYQLTAIGAPAPGLYIAEEIANHRFKIAGGPPGTKVSWQVTGVRQDAYAKAHPLQVEVDKPDSERGYYIHPELYGQPKEKGIEWAQHPEMMREMQRTREKTESTGKVVRQ
jgi:hypothetical protein